MALEVPGGIEIHLIDGLQVLADGREAPLPASRQARALLVWLALDPLNQAANESLLALTRAVAGRQEGQAVLGRTRQRFHQAGLSDAALLAAWRRLSAAQPQSGVIPLPELEPT